MGGGLGAVSTVRLLAPDDLQVAPTGGSRPGYVPLAERCVLVLVGLTGAGKTTTVEGLTTAVALAAIMPDRRALTDRAILPAMSGAGGPVTDRVERFRLTAAFKERYPGGMGDVLSWLLLPADLPPGPVLFDGLRGEAEVAAAARLPGARFIVLDCPPEHRLWRLCGRDDPFDRAAVSSAAAAAGDGDGAMRRALCSEGFDTLVDAVAFDGLVRLLGDRAVEPATAARSAAIIVEESRHYDPVRARTALQRLAPGRVLQVDTGTIPAPDVVRVAGDWIVAVVAGRPTPA